MGRPICYRPNGDFYPLCKGALNPIDFVENDCIRCNLYEDMDDVFVITTKIKLLLGGREKD